MTEIHEHRNLSLGDSIGLVALLFAVLSFVIDPTPWFKLILLAAACICLVIFINISAWTFTWSNRTKLSVSFILIIGLTASTAIRLLQQTSIYLPLKRKLTSLDDLLHRRTALYVESGLLGAVLMLAFLLFIGIILQVRQEVWKRKEGSKGFLDYKLDAEQGLKELPSKLSPITTVIGEVAEMMEAESAKITASQAADTREHIRRLRSFSKRLSAKTATMNRSCSHLEATVRKLKTGISGWSKWMIDTNQTGEHIDIFRSTMKTIATSSAEALNSNRGYVRSLSNLLGVSQDLNVSIHEHVLALERINEMLQGLGETANAALNGLARGSNQYLATRTDEQCVNSTNSSNVAVTVVDKDAKPVSGFVPTYCQPVYWF